MVHLTRLILEFVSFRHGFEPDLAGGKNRYMNAIARISQKQPLPFVFRAEGTRRKLFTVTFQVHAENGHPPLPPAPNMSQASPTYPTVGALGFEEPFGDPADSGEYPFRFQLMLDVHPSQFADMWRQAARGITPSELFVAPSAANAPTINTPPTTPGIRPPRANACRSRHTRSTTGSPPAPPSARSPTISWPRSRNGDKPGGGCLFHQPDIPPLPLPLATLLLSPPWRASPLATRTAPMTGKLSGKTALITGGARGLGRAYALRLASLGADIAIIDRNLKGADVYEFEKAALTADTVMAECEALGVRAIGLEADLTDRDANTRMADEVASQLGRIDIAICNAGGGTVTFADERTTPPGANDPGDVVTTGTPSNCSEEMLHRVLDINILTCIYTCMAVTPHMQRQGGGKIITVSSTAGVDAKGAYFPYGTAKAAIIHYTRALAQELGPHGINVNAIAPGIIRTGRLGDRSHMADQIPLRREGTADDCAGVVEFLATDLSDYVTGRTILIDGGWVR